ncbi:MAG: HD domain-containing phosphohydrolase [Anaerolineaceae bacterium]|nr:HD domain-containing phosphohydrolase [Anaerolineaceae bacterium]
MNITKSISNSFNNLPINIKEKVTIPYLILGIILIVGAAFVVTRVVFDTIEERFTNQLLEAGILASERMVVEENQMLKVLRLLAYSEGVPDALEKADPERLRELTIGNIINNRQAAVLFLDMEGKLVLSAYHIQGGNVEEYEFSSGGFSALKDQPFVSSVLSGEIDNEGNKFSGYSQTEQGNYFFISGPVLNDNREQIGVVLLGKPLHDLAQQIREETLAQITIYDLQGEPLASTFSSAFPLVTAEVSSILDHQDDSTFMETNSRNVSVRNIGYREIFSAWEVRGGKDLGVLGIGLGESFLVSTTRATRLQIALLAVLVFILILLIGMNLSNIITRPIRDLVSASNKVMEGDYNVTVTPTSKDELAVMASTFNKMIKNVNESRIQILESYDITLEGWSRALDLRSEETKGHTDRVTDLMDKMCVAMEIEGQRLTNIRRGTLLHDIGKMGIPDRILNKPGKLTEEEWKIMRFHPTYAYELLKDIHFLRPALTIPLCHHERWDGEGYPRGLKGQEIPIEARMFALVDVWDAITNDRVYRQAMSKEEAFQTIRNGAGNHFDPDITEIFLKVVSSL